MARKKRKASKRNPKRTHKAKRKNPRHLVKAHFAKAPHKRRRARKSNPAKSIRRRTRRRNPMDPIMTAALGVGAGVIAATLVSIGRIKFALTRDPASGLSIENQGISYGLAGAVAIGGLFLAKSHPALGVGIAAGAATAVAAGPLTVKALSLLPAPAPAPAPTTTQGWAQISGMSTVGGRMGAVIAEDMGSVQYQNMQGMGSVDYQDMQGSNLGM